MSRARSLWANQMSRHRTRSQGLRAEIAAAAARIMAEDGIDDFALAKRKAARQLGATETHMLPGNDEVEEALREYLAVYQAEAHPERVRELRQVALEMMQELQEFNPYLTGPVLKGLTSPYTGIELQLFPDSAKDVEIFLLNRDIQFDSSDARRYSGDRARSATILSMERDGVPVRLSVFDSRDERVTLKTSQAGKIIDRATISELASLLGSGNG
jgi:hypothetical protein